MFSGTIFLVNDGLCARLTLDNCRVYFPSLRHWRQTPKDIRNKIFRKDKKKQSIGLLVILNK
jgi:hypothetical protein